MFGRIWNYVSNNALIAGALLLLLGSGSVWTFVKPAGMWLSADAHVMRGAIVLLLLLLLTAIAVILKLAGSYRFDKTTRVTEGALAKQPTVARPVDDGGLTHDATSQVPRPIAQTLTAPRQAESQPPPIFDPESFSLTSSRCRALLVLLHRVDQRTTLNDLREKVVTDGHYVEQLPTNKAQVLQDMEVAESAGLVTIDRIDSLTQLFRLTREGRDWALSQQSRLQSQALKGMYKRDPRLPD